MSEAYLRQKLESLYSACHSPRYKDLDFLWRVYKKQQYAALIYPFHQEKKGEEYIPLRDRIPSVRYNLAKIVVKKSTAMCFAGRNWPQVSTGDEKYTEWLNAFYEVCNFSSFMSRVSTFGSIGTVVPVFSIRPADTLGLVDSPTDVGDPSKVEEKQKIVGGKLNLTLDVWNARDCRPVFSPSGDLISVMIKYLAPVANLIAIGLKVKEGEPLDKKMWYRRELTFNQDITYLPTDEGNWEDIPENLIPSETHTYNHNFGFVPAVWAKNLPSECEFSIDGESTFGEIIDFIIEIDYTLSQTGRGLRYNSDPELLLKEPASRSDGSGPLIRTTSKVIEVTEKGDAKLLEMQGNGQRVAIEYIEKLRNLALEVLRGSRKDPQRAMSHAQSGKLAEMLEDDLISLAAELRSSYGKNCLIPFTLKILAALNQSGLDDPIVKEVNNNVALAKSIRLAWGPWFEPTSADHVQAQQALEDAVSSSRLHIDDARRITYHMFGMVLPKNINWDMNLTNLEQVNIAKNWWQIELARIKVEAAMAAAAAAAEEKEDKEDKEDSEESGSKGEQDKSKKASIKTTQDLDIESIANYKAGEEEADGGSDKNKDKDIDVDLTALNNLNMMG